VSRGEAVGPRPRPRPRHRPQLSRSHGVRARTTLGFPRAHLRGAAEDDTRSRTCNVRNPSSGLRSSPHRRSSAAPPVIPRALAARRFPSVPRPSNSGGAHLFPSLPFHGDGRASRALSLSLSLSLSLTHTHTHTHTRALAPNGRTCARAPARLPSLSRARYPRRRCYW
jgi:hypothetical protein